MHSLPSPHKILIGLGDIQTTRYTQLSSSCIIIFDHLITFNDEVSLIWGSSWSLGKILFIVNRYYPLASVIFNNYAFFSNMLTDQLYVTVLHVHVVGAKLYDKGLRLFQWQAWTGLVACMVAEAILQIRLYALYSLNKKVLVLMLILFFSCSGASAWIIATQLSDSIRVSAIMIPTGGTFCIPTGVPQRFFIFWIPMVANEFVLCALAVFQGIRTFRSEGSIFHSGKRLVGILVRDSISYFFVICATYMTCLLFWLFARDTLHEVPVGFSVAMSCVLANRVVLNVRQMSKSVEMASKQPSTRPKVFDEDSLPGENENINTIMSFATPGRLTMIEMEQLRSMRAERPYGDV